MPGSKTLIWIERLVWILIYGGGLAASLGLFILRGGSSELLGWFLIAKGGIAMAAGVVLIWVRSRWP